MDLYSLGLLETLRAYREGRATVQDYITSCSERIAALEPRIQAWEWFEPSRAMAEAEERAGGILADLPLYGIPVGVKDIINTRGIPTRMGSVIFANHVPTTSAWVVRRLESLGGIVMGKTVTTEFAFRSPGKTRNPWVGTHTPGGSSSGSAAAVAAGFVPVAIGTQTLGSVIRPAAFCGVYGFKPTHGLIPRHGILQLSRTLDHVGLFARGIDDLALLLGELQGFDERDPDTRPRARVDYQRISSEEPPIEPMLAFIKTPHWERADADLKAAYGELQETLGAQIEEVELFPSATDAWDWHRTVMEAEMASNLEPLWLAGKDKLSERLRGLIERGREVRAVDHQRALRSIAPVVESLDDLFRERYDAILTPPALGTAPKGLGATGDPAFCVLWTLLGMPAITLPLMQGENGLPLGVQLVGRKGYDARLLRTARWLEKKISS